MPGSFPVSIRSLDDDFEHPNIAEGHPFRRHVLYRLTRIDWAKHREHDQPRRDPTRP